eukprot:6148566-Ditylum_brightwellii.AAC.1
MPGPPLGGQPPGGPPGPPGPPGLLPLLPPAPGTPSRRLLIFLETPARYATANVIDYGISEG